MGVREIPKQVVYSCDTCSATHKVESEKSKSARAAGWARMVFSCDQIDRGVVVGDATEKMLFCPKCRDVVRQAIDRAVHGLRSDT